MPMPQASPDKVAEFLSGEPTLARVANAVYMLGMLSGSNERDKTSTLSALEAIGIHLTTHCAALVQMRAEIDDLRARLDVSERLTTATQKGHV